jgi:hypothetical protein
MLRIEFLVVIEAVDAVIKRCSIRRRIGHRGRTLAKRRWRGLREGKHLQARLANIQVHREWVGGKKSNKIFGCFGVRADERSGDKFGVFFRGVSGVELCDQCHTLLLFVVPTPMLGPLSRGAWSGEEP